MSKYRLILVFGLFLIFICNIFIIGVNSELGIRPKFYISESITSNFQKRNFELKTDDSSPFSDGIESEVVSVGNPASFDSGFSASNDISLLERILVRNICSLSTRNNVVINKTFHLSPLITKLQI